YCAAQFSRRATSAGSFYVWVTRGLGPGAGHTAGWALQLGYVATGVATILGFGIFGADFLSRVTGGAIAADNRLVLVVLFGVDFLVPLAVAINDMRLSARTSLTLEAISVTLILILCVAIWVHRGGVIDTSQLTLKGATTGGVLVGVVLAIFAFVGFESAGSLGLEARNPHRAIGRAILISCVLVGLFYVVVSYSQVYGFAGTRPGFARSQAPLPDLAGIVGLGAVGWAGCVATFGCMLAYALVSIAAPVFLSRIGERSVPVVAVGAVGALVMAFVFWANWLPQTIPGGLFPALTGVLVWLPYLFL